MLDDVISYRSVFHKKCSMLHINRKLVHFLFLNLVYYSIHSFLFRLLFIIFMRSTSTSDALVGDFYSRFVPTISAAIAKQILQIKRTRQLASCCNPKLLSTAESARLETITTHPPVVSVFLFLQLGHRCLLLDSQTSASGCENSSLVPLSVAGSGF